jgi:hypothetical protein
VCVPGSAGQRQVFAGSFAHEVDWGSRGRGFKSRRPDAGHRLDPDSWLEPGDHTDVCFALLAHLDRWSRIHSGSVPDRSWQRRGQRGGPAPFPHTAAQHGAQVTGHSTRHTTKCRSAATRAGPGNSTPPIHGPAARADERRAGDVNPGRVPAWRGRGSGQRSWPTRMALRDTVWTAIGICPVTVTNGTLWPSQEVIGFAGRGTASLCRTPNRARAGDEFSPRRTS